MNSSNSDGYSYDKQPKMFLNPSLKTKKKKDYICPCGRSYGSYPALYSHIKRKHDGKAPGEVIKPKPLRRRGRPFKYEPVNLQSQIPHKKASIHLEEYLRKVQREEVNQFPLRQFAKQQQFRLSFMNEKNDEEQMQKYHQNQNLMRSNGNEWNKSNLNLAVNYQQKGVNYQQKGLNYQQKGVFPISSDRQQEERGFYNGFEVNGNEDERREFKYSSQQYEDRLPRHAVSHSQSQIQQLKNMQNYKYYINQHPNLSSQLQNHNPSYESMKPVRGHDQLNYNQLRSTHDKGRSNPHLKADYDVFQSIYSKPFEIALNQEMQQKFRPIAQGISDFLEPVLKEIINIETDEIQSPQKQGVVDISKNGEVNENGKYVNDVNDKNGKGNNVDIVDLQLIEKGNSGKIDKPVRQNGVNLEMEQVKGKDYKIQQFLQNQHFRDILKWLMSPPQQVSNRQKENYIESSFRCCLVQFLDFVNNFLQTVQYEQVLLMLVFFCDHILASTGSFELRPQLQIYEMGLYFNTFIHSYLPQLIRHLPVLEHFYLFAEFKKKISELLMWLSSWQAMQQYYHNRYYREMMAYEISQESYKAFMYQKKYQSYIAEANKQNIEVPIQHSFYHPQQVGGEQVQEKREENAEMMVFNQQSKANTFYGLKDGSVYRENEISSQSQNSEGIQENEFQEQKMSDNLQELPEKKQQQRIQQKLDVQNNQHIHSQDKQKQKLQNQQQEQKEKNLLKEGNGLIIEQNELEVIANKSQGQDKNIVIDCQLLMHPLSNSAGQKQINPLVLQNQVNAQSDQQKSKPPQPQQLEFNAQGDESIQDNKVQN